MHRGVLNSSKLFYTFWFIPSIKNWDCCKVCIELVSFQWFSHRCKSFFCPICVSTSWLIAVWFCVDNVNGVSFNYSRFVDQNRCVLSMRVKIYIVVDCQYSRFMVVFSCGFVCTRLQVNIKTRVSWCGICCPEPASWGEILRSSMSFGKIEGMVQFHGPICNGHI